MTKEISPNPVDWDSETSAIEPTKEPSRRRQVFDRFLRHRMAVFGLAVVVGLIFVAIFAPALAPYDPIDLNLANARQPPNQDHLLGTDTFGRDVLSRLIWGSRVSLMVGLVAVTIYESIALVVASVSAYRGGWVDGVIQRFVDVVMSFPSLIVILFFIALLGPSMLTVMLAIGLLTWPEPQRLIRGQLLSLRELDYITALRVLGARSHRIILRHLLPGVASVVVVHATFGVASAIMIEAGLSFLGLGVQPPTPSWGNMLADAQNMTILISMWWLWVPPGLAIVGTLVAINSVGDGLRDALDPRHVLS